MCGVLGVCGQVLYLDRPGSVSRQDGYSIRQDRKCVQKADRLMTGQFPDGWSQGPDTES